ncbi:MAG: hypothetical protein ACJ8R9_05595 [Steroidobacteraceae bacterium]
MGMFDYVLHEGRRYQTKDTPDLCLTEYRIVNNRLVWDEYHFEEVPNAERPYPNGDGLLRLVGCLRRVIDRHNVDLVWHGYLHMIPEDGSEGSFRAKFTDGVLVAFERLPEHPHETQSAD